MQQGPIVVGVDGSAGSRTALVWATRLASALECDVVAVNAYEYVPMLGEETNALALEQALVSLEGEWTDVVRDAAVTCRTVSREGDARALLVSVAAETEAYVLVVGSRGHSQVAEVVLGSVAHYLTHHAPVPVVVVPAGLAID